MKTGIRTPLYLIAVLSIAVWSGCARETALTDDSQRVVTPIELGDANAYLLIGRVPDARPVLVDTGLEGERERSRLEEALLKRGFSWTDLALIILTHGHGDHAGNAAWIAETHGVPILAGAADADMLAAGENGPFEIIGMEARLAYLLVDHTFPPVAPDRLMGPAHEEHATPSSLAALHVGTSFRLDSYGLEGEVIHVGGHTAGSVVVVLDSGEAIVGDLLRGGYLAGRIAPRRPLTHYFHEDHSGASDAIRDLLERGVERLYVGHGGPLDAERVAVWQDDVGFQE